VYGYATRQHYDEVLAIFESFGRVVDRRGVCRPGVSNWIALQYQSRLEAEKALCHQPVQLSGNVFCGVLRLTHDLKQSLEAEWNSAATETSGIPALAQEIDTPKSSLFASTMTSTAASTISPPPPPPPMALTNGATGGLEEKDILLYGDEREIRRNGQKSVCEQLLGWWFGWD
jgi:hypothetical protein